MKKHFLFSLLFLILTLFATNVQATTEIDAITGLIDTSSGNEFDFTNINKKLSDIESALRNQQTTQEDIKNSSSYLAETETILQNAKKQLERDEEFVQKRIEALGEWPKDGTEELEIITQKRKEFSQEMALKKAKIAEADILLAKIYEIGILIVNTHNRELFGNLLTKNPSLLVPKNLYTSTQAFTSFLFNVIQSPTKHVLNIKSAITKNNIISLFLIIGILIFAAFIRRIIIKNLGYKKDISNPSYTQKLKAAIFVAIARGLIPSLIILGFLLFVLFNFDTNDFFNIILIITLHYSLFVILGMTISRVLFAPKYPEWRIINVETIKARKIVRALYWSMLLIFPCLCLEDIAERANYQVELLYLFSTMTTTAKALSLILITNAALFSNDNEDDDTDESNDDASLSNSLRLKLFVNIFAFTIIAVSLSGYFKLAEFILDKLFFSAILILAFYAGKKLLFETVQQVAYFFLANSRRNFRNKILLNIDLIETIIFSPLLLTALIFSLLTLWGVPASLLWQILRRLLFGFHIGNLKISLISIFLGIGVFFAILYLFRLLTAKLRQNLLAKINIDDGIRNSLLTSMRFFGTIIAALLGIVVMGVDLTNLALIAGALSIGIGFGLQNIINNLVSGLIILFERPFNVGDWVVINGEEGKIKQVNIRSTVVETFQRSNVIIPNANLLSSSVINLTRDNANARYSVKVGVAYGSDVEKVKRILLECANNCKLVLKTPEPYVLFQDFGASSLDFELRFFVKNVWNDWQTPSDLRFEINRRFEEEGIEIPFQQVVIHNAKDE